MQHKFKDEIFVDRIQEKFIATDARGRLVMHVPVARGGVYDYHASSIPGWEGNPNQMVKVYRDPAAVFGAETVDSQPAFIPVTWDHPNVFVSEDKTDAIIIGTTGGRVVKDGETEDLLADVVIYNKDYANRIRENPSGYGISLGYRAAVRIEAGTTDRGDHYDAIQYNISGMDHAAIVERPRSGRKLTDQEEIDMAEETKSSYVDELHRGLMEAKDKEVKDLREEVQKLTDENKSLKAQLDSADPFADAKRIAKARELGVKVEASDSLLSLMKTAVADKLPELAAALDGMDETSVAKIFDKIEVEDRKAIGSATVADAHSETTKANDSWNWGAK